MLTPHSIECLSQVLYVDGVQRLGGSVCYHIQAGTVGQLYQRAPVVTVDASIGGRLALVDVATRQHLKQPLILLFVKLKALW